MDLVAAAALYSHEKEGVVKKDSDYFEGVEPQLIYIAKRLKDATRLASILTAAGIDFGAEADEYYGGVIFRRIRTGALFYVRPEFRAQAVAIMENNGYKPEPAEQGLRGTV